MVKSFIPEMAAANTMLMEKISKNGQASVDIENVSKKEEKVIRMDLGVGVFDYNVQQNEITPENINKMGKLFSHLIELSIYKKNIKESFLV